MEKEKHEAYFWSGMKVYVENKKAPIANTHT